MKKLIPYKLRRIIRKLVPDERTERERRDRQDFFYKAFKALSFNGIDGDYVEFGCCGCTTFAMAYNEAITYSNEVKLWAFDSFQGFPSPKTAKDSHPVWGEGKMSMDLEQFHKLCARKQIPRDAYEIIPGFYDKTLPTISDTEEPKNIALAYIDCDLYSSTKEVLDFLWPRLKHGMIIAFDDYFCWSATQISGERMALLEKISENSKWQLLPYIQFSWFGFSFIVEDKNLTSNIAE